jgi:hypothetical protein
VKKLTFTGSTPVGRLLMQQCSSTIKKLALELGGNAPLIVFDDADLDKAVQGAIFAKFRNAGQTCVCANRIYVHDNIYQAFAEKFVQEVQKFKVGNGLEDGVQIGPLINEKAVFENNGWVIKKDYIGKRVMVYYNLHKHTFSVTYKSKVIMHADYVKLGDVEFRVRKGGKDRVRSEKSKNVHAFVIGDLIDFCEYPCDNIPDPSSDMIITYNPYKYDSFVYKSSGEPIYNATEVDMINSQNKLFVVKK